MNLTRQKRSLFIIKILTIFLTTLLILETDRGAVLASEDMSSLLASLEARNARIGLGHDGKTVSFIGTRAGNSIVIPEAASAPNHQAAARAVMQRFGSVFGITNPDIQLRVKKDMVRPDGRSMVRYQQIYEGVPVLGGEIIVNLDASRNLKSVNGETGRRLNISTVPSVTPEQALSTALQVASKSHEVSVGQLNASKPELWIFQPELIGPPRPYFQKLVWRTEVTSKTLAPIRELVLVDAINGFVVLNINQIHTALDRRTHDTDSLGRGIYDDLPGPLVCADPVLNEESCTSGSVPDADNAHHFAGDTYQFLFQHHGRDSLDDNGLRLTSTVRYCETADNMNPMDGQECPYPNAYWSGSQMVYGAGFPVDDVVGHELAHGFTQYTSELFYYYQSGAINESLSDVWGEFVDQTNLSGDDTDPDAKWYIGEDLDPAIFNVSVYGGAFRSMKDPPEFNDAMTSRFYPDAMTSPFYHSASWDLGGVHFNSGVNNKAAFLMTDGGTHNTITVTGLGIAKVADIYYEVQTSMLTSGSNYRDLYYALIQACDNLTGIDGITAMDCVEVKDAVDAVAMDQEPLPFPNTQAEICPTGMYPNHAFYDDLESGSANWTFTRNAGALNWVREDKINLGGFLLDYVPSGDFLLWGPSENNISDKLATITVDVPAGSPMLHFRHYYEFEVDPVCGVSDICDGGVIEYSTNGGTTWNDAGSMIVDGLNYVGVIEAGFGNPLGNRQGYAGVAPAGYGSTRLDLSALAGTTVSFRWRVGTDSAVASIGWMVDDVRVYACSGTPDPNAAPTAASLVGPADGADKGTEVTLMWNAATDPDGDALSYRALICEGAACTPNSQVGAVQQAQLNFTQSLMMAGIGGTTVLMVGFVAAGSQRRRILQATLLLIIGLMMASCGGSSSGGGGSSGPTSDFRVTAYDLNPASTYRWLIRTEDGKGGVTDTVIQSFTTN